MSNQISIVNKQKTVKIPAGTRLLVRRCCAAVLTTEKFFHPAEISVVFVNNDEIKRLNREHRGRDAETDVLSFPQFESGDYRVSEDTGAVTLGDVVISIEKAVVQAAEFGHSLQREIAFLTVHSMLHLLGHHHEEGGLQEVQVREKEEGILRMIGLPRGSTYVF